MADHRAEPTAVVPESGPSTSPGREAWVDFGKGIGISLVVLGHGALALGFSADTTPPILRVVIDSMFVVGLPLFMFLSGLFLGRSLSVGLAGYALGRFRVVVWPYLVWCVLTMVPMGDLSPGTAYCIVIDPPETHLWFLWFLAIYAVIAPLLRRLPIVVTFPLLAFSGLVASCLAVTPLSAGSLRRRGSAPCVGVLVGSGALSAIARARVMLSSRGSRRHRVLITSGALLHLRLRRAGGFGPVA